MRRLMRLISALARTLKNALFVRGLNKPFRVVQIPDLFQTLTRPARRSVGFDIGIQFLMPFIRLKRFGNRFLREKQVNQIAGLFSPDINRFNTGYAINNNLINGHFRSPFHHQLFDLFCRDKTKETIPATSPPGAGFLWFHQ